MRTENLYKKKKRDELIWITGMLLEKEEKQTYTYTNVNRQNMKKGNLISLIVVVVYDIFQIKSFQMLVENQVKISYKSQDLKDYLNIQARLKH